MTIITDSSLWSVHPTEQPIPAREDAFVQSVLAGARSLLGMDVAFIGEITEDSRIFRFVDQNPSPCPIAVGSGDPLEDSYCQRILDGRLPAVIPDTALVPEALRLPVTVALPVGAHLSVPIRLSDGSLYGTFCTFSHQARPSLDERDLDVMRLLSRLIVTHLESARADRMALTQAAADVIRLLRDHDYRTVFQPIVDLLSNDVVGYEALTRFTSGSPDHWFDLATRCGQAIPLELAAIESAVNHLPELAPGVYLSVNLSAATLCSPEFDSLAGDLPLDRIVLELTEQSSVASYGTLIAHVAALRERGARIAVDDAGAGYSGLQRILAVSPDIVKLDRELISGIDADEARQSLARAMSWFTTRTGNQLVAEGIETAAERRVLTAIGIRYGQGYALGRPSPLPGHGLPAPRRGSRAAPHSIRPAV